MRIRLLLTLCLLPLAVPAADPQTDQAAMQPGVATSPPVPAPARTPAARPADKPAPTVPATAPAAGKAAPATGAARRTQDRLELDTTQITGNRELPRVMYVVPWKRSDLGDLGGRPAHSLLDEVLTPVDRDVFLRQNRYYDALKPDVAPSAPTVVRPEDEK
ncbi:MAG: hypothetical protein ABI859_02065 [Pseudomonadota bacterium]